MRDEIIEKLENQVERLYELFLQRWFECLNLSGGNVYITIKFQEYKERIDMLMKQLKRTLVENQEVDMDLY